MTLPVGIGGGIGGGMAGHGAAWSNYARNVLDGRTVTASLVVMCDSQAVSSRFIDTLISLKSAR
jgi:hypothetical protein